MRLIREPAIASRGEWARAPVAFLLAAGVALWLAQHKTEPRPPVPDATPLIEKVTAQAERLDARRMLAMDAARAAPEGCLTGVASLSFRGAEVVAKCRHIENVGRAAVR